MASATCFILGKWGVACATIDMRFLSLILFFLFFSLLFVLNPANPLARNDIYFQCAIIYDYAGASAQFIFYLLNSYSVINFTDCNYNGISQAEHFSLKRI